MQGQNQEMLLAACEQFLGKAEQEIRRVALETLEGHQRAIMGSMTIEVKYSICNFKKTNKKKNKSIFYSINFVFFLSIFGFWFSIIDVNVVTYVPIPFTAIQVERAANANILSGGFKNKSLSV